MFRASVMASLAAAALTAPAWSGGNQGTTCGNAGPDVIVGELLNIIRWGANGSGTISGYSLGTESCNIGDENLSWQPTTADHPVIAQSIYRYENGRFEHIGMGWLKHGYTALTFDLCGCGCNDQGGPVLGVGCSDPYGASLNGDQNGFPCGETYCGGLGPRSEVNAATGEFAWPHGLAGESGGALFKRIRVTNNALDPALNPTALYFGEGQYVAADDAAAGNHSNNASFREILVGAFVDNGWSLSFTGPTTREQAAIYAWQAIDPGVVIEVVDDQSDGRFNLGYRVTDNGDGTWHYEYALHNQTSHQSARAFVVPLGEGVTLGNVQFRDVHYHSGDGAVIGVNYSGANWTLAQTDESISWSTVTEAEDPNANALRWGTLYNFRFDADQPPGPAIATIGLYRAGPVSEVLVPVLGPKGCPWDLNGDSSVTTADLLELLSEWGTGPSGPPDFNDDGIVGTADLLEMLANWGLCPGVEPGVCGDPAAGSCFQDNGTPGCNDEKCCEIVCAVDPNCCDIAWDAGCKDMANSMCGDCGDPAAGECCEPNGTPGCDDPDCCRIVCGIDAFCCEITWDELCADEAHVSCKCPP